MFAPFIGIFSIMILLINGRFVKESRNDTDQFLTDGT